MTSVDSVRHFWVYITWIDGVTRYDAGKGALTSSDAYFLYWVYPEADAREVAASWFKNGGVLSVGLSEVAQEVPGKSAWLPVGDKSTEPCRY